MTLFNSILKLPHKLYEYNLKPRVKKAFPNIIADNENSILQKEFIKKLNRYKVSKKNNSSIILCQAVEDYAMCIRLAAVSNLLSKKFNSEICFYSVGTKLEDARYLGEGFIKKLLSNRLYKPFDNLYLAFGKKIITRNIWSYKDQKLVNKTFYLIRKKIKSKYDILEIEIEGVKIGDLVNDTYLRFRSKPTVDITDTFFDKIIREAINIYYNINELLLKYNVKAILNTYTTYIHHGIIIRICQQKKIAVYSIGGYYSLLHKVLPEFPSHANNHFLFHKTFKNLNGKSTLISSVKDHFEKRFKGEIDRGTIFMKESAFSSKENIALKEINWSNSVVLLAHCFFDSPHIYRDLLFPDFYEWIIFTLDVLLENSEINIIVKPHPNGIDGNDEIFEALAKKYKGRSIIFIDKKTSQLQIMQNKPCAIITAYGTAAAEFAYKGFPVLTIYDNPFTAYDFIHLAKTIQEYKQLLQNIMSLKPKQKTEEILEYYYMQCFFYMKGRDPNYLDFLKYKGQNYSEEFLKDYLHQMNEAYFEKLNEAMIDGFELIEWEEKQGIYTNIN